MKRTRIKCCGMTRVEDAVLAASLGADAIGLVFTRRSKRFVDIEQATRIRLALPPYVSVVALFMDDEASWISEVERTLRPHLLQFHGIESPAFCTRFATAYVKTLAMASAPDVAASMRAHDRASGFLLDGHGEGEAGGSGRPFDWSLVPRDGRRPCIVAGGLDAHNVGHAIAVAQPWAVDVASGIESSPGIKDQQKLQAFVEAVRAADVLSVEGCDDPGESEFVPR